MSPTEQACQAMPIFEYKAMDVDGAMAAGTVVADTPRQAREQLREKGLRIAEVRPCVGRGRRGLRLRSRRQSQDEAVLFIRELATMLAAGIPLLKALDTLSRQHRQPFRAVVQHLADRVSAGASLAEAMEEQPGCFDELCVSIAQVGESTGNLDEALGKLAEFKEKTSRLRSRISSALMYPAVICLVGLAVSTFLMTYVVPNLLGTLVQAGRELPAITRAVKAGSDFLLAWWWAILLGVAGLAAAAKLLLRTSAGRLAADRAILRIPVVGPLVRKETTSRIAVVMAALLRSGLQFIDAIRITRRTMRNRVFHLALCRYEEAIAAGRDVAGPLEASGVFSPMVVQMLAVGQQTGQMEQMLEQLAEAYDHEVAVSAQRLTALLEPVLIVLLAILVGSIALATLLPILEVSNVL